MRFLVACLFAANLLAQGPTVDGLWVGTLDAGVTKLRLAFHLNTKGASTFDSLDQKANGIPLDSVTVTGTHVSITSKAVGGSYEAELLDGGKKLQGMWKQGAPMPLVLVHSETMPEGPKRPQMPKGPFPYKSEDVTYLSVNPDVKLAATLTLPEGPGPFPAVVMITGSGPQDRDETLMGHKPFWVIADYLSRRGIAVLRADDRGVGKSTGKFSAGTSLDFMDDAEGGVRFLAARKDISTIGLIGHSEGGMIAPMLANRAPQVKFIVSMAGTGVPGDALLLEQNRMLFEAAGLKDSSAPVERLKKLIGIILAEPDIKVAKEKARAAFADVDARLKTQIEAQIDQIATPWFRFFLGYDPGTAWAKLKQPALVLNGTLDLQVSAAQNLPVIEQKLKAAGNKDSKIVKLDGLNHLFQHAKTGAVTEYQEIEETVSPEVLAMIADWIKK